MSKKFVSGDVKLIDVRLTSQATKAFIVPIDQIRTIDVFEDMGRPTMYASLLIHDSINMLQTFPIIGEETLTIEMITPGMPRSAKFKFRVYKISKVVLSPDKKRQAYTLECVSEEHLYNATRVKQAYEGQISTFVPSILKDYLNTTKPIAVDETKGVQKYVIPTLQPLEAIDMLRQRAVSKQYASSAYAFFENQAGFNFKTVESLIQSGTKNIGTRVFNMNTNLVRDKNRNDIDAYRTILKYEYIVNLDGVDLNNNGAFGSLTKSFDIVKKDMTDIAVDVEKMFGNFIQSNKGSTLPQTMKHLQQFAKNDMQLLVPKIESMGETFIEQSASIRQAFITLLNNNITRVMVHGDTGLKVGDVVTLNVPESSGFDNRKGPQKMVAANYLVIRLRHHISISTTNKHIVSMDVVKLGMSK